MQRGIAVGIGLAAWVVGAMACGDDSAAPAPSPALVGGAGGGGDATTSAGGAGGAVANDPTVPFWGSGSRLKAVVVHPDEGDAQVFDMLDTELEVIVGLGEASDGSLRWLPYEQPTVGNSYADASCTEPLASRVVGSRTCPPPRFATRFTPTGCPWGEPEGSTEVYELGAPTTPAVVYRMQSGACVEGAPTVNREYFTVGPPVPPSTLVGGERRFVPVGGRALVRVAVADDGAYHWEPGLRSLYEQATGEACTFTLTVEGNRVCVPAFLAGQPATVYLGDTCEVPVLLSPSDPACPTPTMGVANDLGFYALGAEVTEPAALYRTAGSQQCIPWEESAAADYRAFEVGAPLDLGGYYALEIDAARDDRLNPLYREVEGDRVGLTRWWYDADRSERCVPMVVNGSLRCVHDTRYQAGGGLYQSYADDECTVPLVSSIDPLDEGWILVPDDGERSCDVEALGTAGARSFTMRSVTLYEGPTWYQNGADCEQAAPGFGSFYELGPEADETIFPTLTVEIE